MVAGTDSRISGGGEVVVTDSHPFYWFEFMCPTLDILYQVNGSATANRGQCIPHRLEHVKV